MLLVKYDRTVAVTERPGFAKFGHYPFHLWISDNFMPDGFFYLISERTATVQIMPRLEKISLHERSNPAKSLNFW